MDKRTFLLAAGAFAAMPALAAKRRAKAGSSSKASAKAGEPVGQARGEQGPQVQPRPSGLPVVLTISGRISRSNRGPSDGALDQLMKRQGIQFDKAFTFTMPELLRFPSSTVRTTLEYDGQSHTLRGPQLSYVLRGAGVDTDLALRVTLRAVDGYAATLSLGEIRDRNMIVATHLDDKPLSLGGLGPLWAVFDPGAQADLKDKPLNERFASCPWGLYFIEVAAA